MKKKTVVTPLCANDQQYTDFRGHVSQTFNANQHHPLFTTDATDLSGEWFAYEIPPTPEEKFWCCRSAIKEYIQIPSDYAPKWAGDWKGSLVVRPGKEAAK